MAANNPKLQKKLKDFHKEKEKASRRFKSLASYLDAVSEEDRQQFFNVNYEQIFAVFLARMGELEGAAKKDKKQQLSDVTALMDLLKKFLILLPNLIKKRWQFATITRIINLLLERGNKHPVRKLGFDLLLNYMEILQTSIDEQTTVFANSIVLEPFLKEDPEPEKGNKIKIPGSKARNNLANSANLVPSSKEPSRNDAIDLFKQFFDFISKRDGKFEFWFEIWKSNYYAVFYPESALSLGIIKQIADTRFQQHAPFDIQACVVERLALWADDQNICNVLWQPKNGLLMMEISRQACVLPIRFAAATRQCFDCFRIYIMNATTKAKISDSDLQVYFVKFMQNISQVFFIDHTSEELDQHATLSKEVLAIYDYFSFQLAKKLEDNTWVSLQNIMLNSTYDLLRSSSPFTSTVATAMADFMFQCLFVVWIRSKITTDEMWGAFNKKVSVLVPWRATVMQWKMKVLQLTFILIEHWYPSTEHSQGAVIKSNDSSLQYRDTKLTQIQWDKNSVFKMWFTLFHIIGNINAIQEPDNFATAVSCLSEVAEMLLAEEDKLEIGQKPPIDSRKILLPWLLEACGVEEKRNRGRLIAFTICCKIFLLEFAPTPDVKLITHFYRTVLGGLQCTHPSIVWALVRHASSIFSLGLPGATVLIPAFLREIEKLWKPGNKTPEDVQEKSLKILISLICYPRQFPTMELHNEGKKMAAEEVLEKIGKMLVVALNTETKPSIKEFCLWGIGLFVYQELEYNPKKELLGECLRGLVQCCAYKEDTVAQTALDCLSNIATRSKLEKIASVDNDVILFSLDNISDNIIGLVGTAKAGGVAQREKVVVGHLVTLVTFLMAIGQSKTLELTPQIVTKAFRALEWGILGEELIPHAVIASRPLPQKKLSGKKGKTSEPAQLTFEGLFETLKKEPSHNSKIIREAAEFALFTLLNQFSNYPSPAGNEQITSFCAEDVAPKKEEEDEDDTMFYFIYNERLILGVEEMEDDDGKFVRLTVRDCTGKFVWDFKLSYTIDGATEEQVASITPRIFPPVVRERGQTLPYTRPFGDPPRRELLPGSDVDPMKELLRYVDEAHPEITKSKRFTINRPLLPNEVYLKDLQEFQETIMKQIDVDEQLQSNQDTRRPLPLLPYEPCDFAQFHNCRLLLSHLGFLSPENRIRMHFLSPSKRFQRSLKELDKVNGRELCKVGLIYVKMNQDEQYSILKNERKGASGRYCEFVKGLGWIIDLKTHRGFMGGLDRINTAGETAPYWSDVFGEVVFHEVARMPTKENDAQQIHKKRHVGNDVVHIVWCENKKEYNPQTITSQFNDVHLVIYPLSNGLFRIRIYKKEGLPSFGPLQDGMVVTKRLLGPLCRTSAMSANYKVRSDKPEYKRPFALRSEHIKLIFERYTSEKSFESYMEKIFLRNSDQDPFVPEKPPNGTPNSA